MFTSPGVLHVDKAGKCFHVGFSGSTGRFCFLAFIMRVYLLCVISSSSGEQSNAFNALVRPAVYDGWGGERLRQGSQEGAG